MKYYQKWTANGQYGNHYLYHLIIWQDSPLHIRHASLDNLLDKYPTQTL